MMRFDRFTERAQDAAARAYEILQRYGHSQVDTEHILMALIEQPEGLVGGIVEKLGVDPNAVVSKLDDVLRASPRVGIYGSGATAQVFITPRVKKILDVANEEANRLKDEYISTEHIFLAISTERNTSAAKIMADVGITREKIMDIVTRRGLLGDGIAWPGTNAIDGNGPESSGHCRYSCVVINAIEFGSAEY